MSDEMKMDDLPKQKRKYTRHIKIRPLRQSRQPTPPKPAAKLADAEIDTRLAQAIRDRSKAMQMVSKLAYWQDRLMRIEQEINSLIGFQQRLMGQSGQAAAVPISTFPPPNFTPPPAYAGHLASISPEVTSIPTKVANPKPSGGNVADIAGEGGFS
jgi:hypothetical protein